MLADNANRNFEANPVEDKLSRARSLQLAVLLFQTETRVRPDHSRPLHFQPSAAPEQPSSRTTVKSLEPRGIQKRTTTGAKRNKAILRRSVYHEPRGIIN